MNNNKMNPTAGQQQTPSTAASSNTSGKGVEESGASQSQSLYITHVDSFGPYLNIYGQLNRDAMNVVRAKMLQLVANCYAVDANDLQQPLGQPGKLCLYKNVKGAAPGDYEVMRARIQSVMGGSEGGNHIKQVEVEFVDYGYNAVVASNELLFPQHPEMMLQNIPTMCSHFIALGVCKDWKKSELDEISRMIKHQTLEICIKIEFNQFKFITLKWKDFNFAEFLIHQKKIGAPIANDLLRDNFIKMLKKQQPQQQQQPELRATNSNNNNNIYNNYYTNTNNNINVGNNNNPMVTSNSTSRYETSKTPIGSSMGRGASQLREQMAAKRSLAARLQQQQQQQMTVQMQQNMLMHALQPRLPTAIGNLRSISQGIHIPSQRSAFIAPRGPIWIPYNEAVPNIAVMSSATAFPAYAARYQYQVATTPQLQPQPKQYYQNVTPFVDPLIVPQRQSTVVATATTTATATFKSNNLTVGQVYDVCVSFVENGPCLFSVQLASVQDELTEMMNRIERVHLKPLSEKPVLGTACIARYSEDGQLYRALITGVQPAACKVAYIDYGNAELVNFRDLYIIPEDFLQAKAYAIRFTLSGHKELEPIDESLKKAFKDLVIYKNFKLKVMPLEGPPLVQYCELYSQEKNLLDVLKQIQKCRLVYAKAEPLKNNDIVEIRYIDSPKHFYVQKVSNIAKFEELMDDMFLYYNKNQQVPNHLALGAPCIVKYENEWYRAEVMRADAAAIVVRHVDFGYEQKVTKNLLSTIAEKHLKLPRQAVQCCLKGFENNELNKDLATTQFEMLAEESNRKRRSFTVKVFRIQPDGVNLVNLCTKDLNVMKKLYKLSMPFEQYLTLEKEEFNIHNGHHQRSTGGAENGHKTPSIASSSDLNSMHSNKKGNFLNSTPLKTEGRVQQQQQQQQQRQQQKEISQTPSLRVSHNNSFPSQSTEWDKISSASSMDNRDSRSSSSEHKVNKRNQQPQQLQQPQQHQRASKNHLHDTSASSSNFSDRRSTGSGGSGKARGGSANLVNIPPRFQQQQQHQENRRHNKQRTGGHQRPQNAPQGYSQQSPHKPPSSNRSSDSHTSVKEQQLQQHKQVPVPELAPVSVLVSVPVPEEYMALDCPFPQQHIATPVREEVTICWWISPHQFFTHLKSRTSAFELLMREMQQFYKSKSPQTLQLKAGCYVVARNRRDNMVYRARILACNQMLRKYKVHFVDFGNQYTVTSEDIWLVEKRFADMPTMAYLCSFNGIVSNFDHLYIIDRMEKYLPAGASIVCEYIERRATGDAYYVNVHVNKVSLKTTLVSDGLITEVCPELCLTLLAGQQIRAKISSIKDMLNFKIHFEGCEERVKLLCTYDDVRYVKSNPDIAQKFKQFYEGKSCVVNIKDVNDNKVVMLRPLMPLLKEDMAKHIATYPVVLEKFDARVAYVASSYRLYVHMAVNESKISQLLDAMYEYYEKQGIIVENCESDQMCAAKSKDGNWYRARIIGSNQSAENSIEVYYIDYGNGEKVPKRQLKQLEERFIMNQSAYGLEINLPVKALADKGKSKQKSGPQDRETEATVKQTLDKLLLDKLVVVEAVEMRHNHLIADVKLPELNNRNVIDVLKEKQQIKGRDLESMRKLLDKERPNMLEFIEMVDLTLEDEDEALEKGKREGNKDKNTSPKKKKSNKVEEKTDRIERKQESSTKTEIGEQSSVAHVAVAVAEKKVTAVIAPAAKVTPAPETGLTSAGVSKSTSPTRAVSPNSVESRSESSNDPYADMEHAILSHCDNPAQFYIHLQEKVEELRKLQENLQIVASSLPPLMRVINNAHCISLYSVDKQWYRAKILDAELMVLQFIDFGNTDCVSDTTDIKEMSVFPDIEPLCVPCALPIKPNGTADWVDAANAIFNDSYSKMLHFEYITRGNTYKRSFINLYIEGVNIAERLIKDGYAKPLEVVNSGENCYISHVNGLTDFYIQYEKDSKALELIEIYLANNEKLKEIKKFELGKIVAALFPDDEMWYRAKLVKEVPNRGYEVMFIDYGNTSVSPECREISEEIADLPPLSKKCMLELPESCLSWSDAAEEKFAEIAALGETIFTVELREPAAGCAVVHLLIDGHNVNDDLEPLCEHKPLELPSTSSLNSSFCNSTIPPSECEAGTLYEGIVSQVNSFDDFYVQLKKDAARLEDLNSSLNAIGMDVIQQPKVGELCAAPFAEDNAFYRARILEALSADSKKYRVLFVDFGNEAITSDLRALPHDIQQLKEFSKRCRLHGADYVPPQLQGVATETFNALLNGCQALVKLDFLPDETEVAAVRLFTANTDENIGEKLYSLLDTNMNAAARSSALPNTPKANTCLISHAVSPTEFYIQLQSASSQMELVAKSLQKSVVEQLPMLATAELERVCSVYSTEDDCYYRGRVKRVLAGSQGFEICLLDFGNIILSQQLRELPPELCSVPALALKCRLNKVPAVPDSILEERFATLLEAHFGEIYELEKDEIDKESRVHTVKLQVNYKDLAEELAKAVESSALIDTLTAVPTLYDCTIIHVNSPASFYVQLSGDVAALEKITDTLLDAESDFQPFTELQVGAVCCAQFPEDSAFYRAKIVQLLDEGKCEVHYLDFGNNSITDQFRQLPKNLLDAEPYSRHCALEGNFNSVEACAHFQTLTDSRFSETFQVEFLKTSEELNICRLFYQDKNVASELSQLLKATSVNESWQSTSLTTTVATAVPSSGVSSMEESDCTAPVSPDVLKE